MVMMAVRQGNGIDLQVLDPIIHRHGRQPFQLGIDAGIEKDAVIGHFDHPGAAPMPSAGLRSIMFIERTGGVQEKQEKGLIFSPVC